MRKILFAASECAPFVKTGGLGDVIASLPKYISGPETDVRVILPYYSFIDSKLKKGMKKTASYEVDLFGCRKEAEIYELVRGGVRHYFIASEGSFDGDIPYQGEPGDIDRFAFFCKAVLSALPVLDFAPDIIHCHDWQTGLIPPYIRTLSKSNPFYSGVKTILTIHNLRFQGMWDKEYVRLITGLEDSYFSDECMGFYDKAGFLKGGIACADYVTTVSETYAKEIRTPFFGEGLDGILCSRTDHLAGIVNGIDYDVFDPATDKRIAQNYSVEDFRKKKGKNKRVLQTELGLDKNPKAMMIGVISRLTDQKGIDLIAYMMDELCSDAIQLVILGTGEERYESMFRHYAWKYPGKVSANAMYSEDLSHRIYAASDAFLMPSLFEPCGLSQLMAMRYGAVPIVRETGGLRDTVQAYNEYEHTGTGFSFANYNAHEMLGTIRYAERIFYDYKRDWNKITERAMNMDYSWNASAKKYQALYDRLTEE